MMTHKEYNGWTNYETWLVKLWQDNSEGDQSRWQEQAEECIKTDGRTDSVTSLADIMREEYDRQSSELIGTNGVFVDLLTAALHEVDWEEIAQHYIDESADALDLEGTEIES